MNAAQIIIINTVRKKGDLPFKEFTTAQYLTIVYESYGINYDTWLLSAPLVNQSKATAAPQQRSTIHDAAKDRRVLGTHVALGSFPQILVVVHVDRFDTSCSGSTASKIHTMV